MKYQLISTAKFACLGREREGRKGGDARGSDIQRPHGGGRGARW